MSATVPGKPLSIEVISDVVCPWCYIGKRRMEKAVAQSAVPLRIQWRPYQLDATIPAEGKDRRAYMEAKFGSAERIAQIQANIAAAGAEEGIAFTFDRIKVSPNTLNAHRLIRWAGDQGCQDEVVEALFAAYFLQGRDIGDPVVLADIAEANGMDRATTERRLGSEDDRDEVRQEVETAHRIGVTGVPTFVLASRYALVGAQPAEAIAEALRSVSAQQD